MMCVDCGQEVAKTIRGSCPACFATTVPLLEVPDSLDVELCAHCDARQVGPQWVDPQPDVPPAWIREEAARESLRVHPRVADAFLQLDETAQDEKHFQYRIQLEGTVEGVPVQARAELLVRQRRGVCDRCSRLFGDYFAAVIQLRATDRDVTPAELAQAHHAVAEEMERMRATGNRYAFLSRDEAIHGGWDYYVGDIEAARQASRILKQRLGATVQETAKLVGRREGENVHRVTFLVRIRLFSPGDFAVDRDHNLVQVTAINQGRMNIVDVVRDRRDRADETDLRRLGGLEKVRWAVLVSAGEKDLQVLDPVTFRTQDVLRPHGFAPHGQTVPVIRHEERMYIPAIAPPDPSGEGPRDAPPSPAPAATDPAGGPAPRASGPPRH